MSLYFLQFMKQLMFFIFLKKPPNVLLLTIFLGIGVQFKILVS